MCKCPYFLVLKNDRRPVVFHRRTIKQLHPCRVLGHGRTAATPHLGSGAGNRLLPLGCLMGPGKPQEKNQGKRRENPKFWAHLRNYTSIDPKQHKSSLRHPHRFLWFLFMGLRSVMSIACRLYFLRRPAPPPSFYASNHMSALCHVH